MLLRPPANMIPRPGHVTGALRVVIKSLTAPASCLRIRMTGIIEAHDETYSGSWESSPIKRSATVLGLDCAVRG